MELERPAYREERRKLYERYLDGMHPGTSMTADRESFESFLCDSPMESMCMDFYFGQKLVLSGLIDVCPNAVSLVYSWYDPDDTRRSLGKYFILRAIDWCRENGIDYCYLGYYIAESRKMNYKTAFRPCQILNPDGEWITIPARQKQK
jgi:arginine-tRNA-protein transferase